MLEELQFINLWLKQKDPYLMQKHTIDKTYFVVLNDIVTWVEEFRDEHKILPSLDTVAKKFDDFRELDDLENVNYVVNVLKEQRAYMDYRPVLTSNAEMLRDGHTIEAMSKMRGDIDSLLKKFTGQITKYDWIKNSAERYLKYLEKHGKEGLSGITTGIPELDDITGGWKEDDLVLLAGRTNEGKTFIGLYVAYKAWLSFKKAGITDPVVYISTEMPELEVAYRLDTLRSHFSNRELNEGKLKNAELYKEFLEGLEKEDTSFLILTQESNGGRQFTPSDIRAMIERERPGLLVIDQLYDISDGTSEKDIRKRIVNVSNQIREINLYTKTPTILLAQASRESAKEAKKDKNASPELHSIQESDNPAQKATRVVTMRKIDDVFKLSIKKNRGGPKDKDVFLRADLDRGIFEPLTEDEMAF